MAWGEGLRVESQLQRARQPWQARQFSPGPSPEQVRKLTTDLGVRPRLFHIPLSGVCQSKPQRTSRSGRLILHPLSGICQSNPQKASRLQRWSLPRGDILILLMDQSQFLAG